MTYYVYRIWNKWDTLLYIGFTDNLERRMNEHRRGTPWIRQAARWESTEEYDTEEDARSAEARAINLEHPQFNLRYKGNTRKSAEGRKNFRSRMDWNGGNYYPHVGS